jgi:ATP-dependent Clp protease ATP-binding subunit ClpA
VALDDEILREAKAARDRLIAAQRRVDQARGDYHHAIRRLCAAGGSMREIAEALGLSHQRVHQIVEEQTTPIWRRRGQLFAGRMTRFTRDARSVAVVAQEEARALGHDRVGAEHVLLALFTVEGVAARVLESLGVSADAVRERVGRGPGSSSGNLPLSPEAKKLLERALREALALKHRNIGTEHVLLALADEDALKELGVDGDRIRAEIQRRLAA